MIRSYALVVLNSQDQIIDRINLPIITNPQENGFKLSLSKISSDIEDLITKVTQQKVVKKFNVIQHQNPYSKSFVLSNWIQKYSRTSYRMCLEYKDPVLTRYCEGKVTSLDKTEKDEFGLLTQALEFTPITPYFIRQENTIVIQKSTVGKKYPFCYPYAYGTSVIENNEINNPYILDIPIIVTIEGALDNPTVDLLDENGEVYSKVRFSNFTLNEGEKLIINSAQRKIYKIGIDGIEIDFIPEVDPQYDTFLRAQSGLSTIAVNISDAGTGFRLTGGWRQYTL